MNGKTINSIIKGTQPWAVKKTFLNSLQVWIGGLLIITGLISQEELQGYKWDSETETSVVPKAAPAALTPLDLYVKPLVVFDSANKIPAIKAIREVTELGLKEAKEMVDSIIGYGAIAQKLISGVTPHHAGAIKYVLGQAGLTVWANTGAGTIEYPVVAHSNIYGYTKYVPAPPQFIQEAPMEKAVKKPLPGFLKPGVIPLREAQAIGQKCKGTSATSVYYCVAFNARVKIATRLSGGQISIRAEWEVATTDEINKLTESGLNPSGSHASMHLNAENFSAEKIIGGYLLSTGIEFDQIITSGAQLVKE